MHFTSAAIISFLLAAAPALAAPTRRDTCGTCAYTCPATDEIVYEGNYEVLTSTSTTSTSILCYYETWPSTYVICVYDLSDGAFNGGNQNDFGCPGTAAYECV